MFFDASGRRVLPLLLIVGALVTATAWSAMLWFTNRPLERAVGEAFARAQSQVEYTLRFKLPSSLLAAVGGAQAGNPPAEVPATNAISVPVLLYHGEGGGPSMTTATFVEQMRALHNAGWRTITMEEFKAFMRGTGTVPDKSFLLTFDDGRTDTFYVSDPVLKDFGYTAVMFVITGLSLPDNRDTAVNGFYLNKNELAFMAASGRWELESHGEMDHGGYDVPTATSTAGSLTMIPSTHFLSNLFWLPTEGRLETVAEHRARITGDLARSKDTLAQDFSIPVTGYAYPFNDFGQETVNFPGATPAIENVVRDLYDYAFYQTWPGNGDSFNYPSPSDYLVKRIEPTADWSGKVLLSVLEGGRPKPLPYYSAGPFGADWQVNWGSVATGQTLRFHAIDSTTGAAGFLNGTEGWEDYSFAASANVISGTISLIARHTKAGTPYVVCAFSGDHIYLEKHTGNIQTTIATTPYAPPTVPGTYRVGMSVDGQEASCSAYGVTLRANVPDIPARGGIGISIWGPQSGEAEAVFTSLSANAP